MSFHLRAIARDAAVATIRLVADLPGSFREARDQAERAAVSVVCNIDEGNGRSGRSRRHHWEIAYGSAWEAQGVVELVAAVGKVPTADAERVVAQLDQTRRILWRLMHPRR
jgi:four helix bundle protein